MDRMQATVTVAATLLVEVLITETVLAPALVI
jgi:hypothetical protein